MNADNTISSLSFGNCPVGTVSLNWCSPAGTSPNSINLLGITSPGHQLFHWAQSASVRGYRLYIPLGCVLYCLNGSQDSPPGLYVKTSSPLKYTSCCLLIYSSPPDFSPSEAVII